MPSPRARVSRARERDNESRAERSVRTPPRRERGRKRARRRKGQKRSRSRSRVSDDWRRRSRSESSPRTRHRQRAGTRSRRSRSTSSDCARHPSNDQRRSRSRRRRSARSRRDERQDKSEARQRQSRMRGSKRKKSLVGDSSSNNSNSDQEQVSEMKRKCVNASKDIRDDKVSFSAQDVIDLIKSLPSSLSQNQNHFSMHTNALPEFDPANKEQTIDVWINKVEECSTLYQWSKTQLLHYALPKLAGVAKVWYQGLPSVKLTWVEWKEKLTKTFPTVQNYAQLLHEMLDRNVKSNESLETYFYHKMNLLNRCEISGKKAIDCIIYGLEDRSMRLGAQAANYSQPEDLLAYLKSVKVDDFKERSPLFKRRNDSQADGNKPPSSNTTIVCFNCGEAGHPSFRCTKPLVTCSVCNRLGHQASSCKRLIKNQEGSKPVENEKRVAEGKD